MAAQWLMTDQELETKDSETDQEELFVFGYACKVFRDDDKAQYIDEGRHLIPWMGDDRLLIDRSVPPELHRISKGFDLCRFTASRESNLSYFLTGALTFCSLHDIQRSGSNVK